MRRLRAGNNGRPAAAVNLASIPSINPDSTPSNWDLVRIVSAAVAAWEKQLERVDRFTLPLFRPLDYLELADATQDREPSNAENGPRASAATQPSFS